MSETALDANDPFPEKTVQSYLDRITLPINELHVHNNDGANPTHSPPHLGKADMETLAVMLRRKGCRASQR